MNETTNEALRALLDENRWLAAERAARARIAASDRDEMARLYLAEALGGTARYTEARTVLLDVLSRAPADKAHHAYWRLGHLFQQMGRFARAAECYQQAAASAPEDAAYRVFLGGLLLTWGRLEQAVAVLSAGLACKVGPVEEALLNLGLAYRGLGQHEKAREAWLAALAIQPDYQEVLVALEDLDRAG